MKMVTSNLWPQPKALGSTPQWALREKQSLLSSWSLAALDVYPAYDRAFLSQCKTLFEVSKLSMLLWCNPVLPFPG